MDNIEVGMLIGANCMKALEPMEIISSRNGGPYTYRTKLGWCIVGPITTSRNDSSVKCHRIAVKDVASGKIAPHHFVLDDEPKIEDVGIKEMLERMCYSDFCECNHLQMISILGNIEDISREDREFLDILETGTRKDGAHYEVPLPFRNIGIQLPNNRNQAVKRMHHLKRRFIKDPQFFEEYKRQMEELVSKCYAKKRDIKPDNGKLWHLLHHGVKHPSKPGKVRIVFNCSTNYRGASLNRNQLLGPDLTNQLIGILMRFRTEDVAFMGDIEAMFCQVKVPDSERSFFRYLWWSNNDLNGELVDY